jgi:hypothetical protein
MHLLRQPGRDFRGGTPFSRSPVVHQLACAAPRELRDRASAAVAAPNAHCTDPSDLVGRAYALLEQEAQAWQQRQRADLLPGSRR